MLAEGSIAISEFIGVFLVELITVIRELLHREVNEKRAGFGVKLFVAEWFKDDLTRLLHSEI